MSALRTTCNCASVRLLMRAANGTSSARAIFHSTLIEGALRACSIWLSIAFETPDKPASLSSERSISERIRFTFSATTPVRFSVLVFPAAGSVFFFVFVFADLFFIPRNQLRIERAHKAQSNAARGSSVQPSAPESGIVLFAIADICLFFN